MPRPRPTVTFVTRLGHDLPDDRCPEVSSLGRTMQRLREQIAAWHQAVHERAERAANNLIKRVKRIAFGITRFRSYASRPNGSHPAEIRRAVKARDGPLYEGGPAR